MTPIDQNKVTKTNRTPEQLLHFLLWTTTVAGKRSDVQTEKFNELFKHNNLSILANHGNSLRAKMRAVGLGQYSRLVRCWKHIYQNCRSSHLKTITRDKLMEIPGIGPKTASFFIAHSQPWPEIAVLDTHILKWLQKEFPKQKIPKVTPSDPDQYRDIEALFLGRSCQLNTKPSDLDTLIWQKATNHVS
jgi:thermostable 8-oxoguanine DNA glycosylase